MIYLILRIIHLLGVVQFLGNLIVSAYWKVQADRTNDLKLVVFAYKEVIRSDYFFTIPGAAMIFAGGCGMAFLVGYPFLQVPWLFWSLIFLGTSGMLWLLILAPAQRKMLRLAENALKTGHLDPRLAKLSKIWYLVGSVATILPLIAGFLMIAQIG